MTGDLGSRKNPADSLPAFGVFIDHQSMLPAGGFQRSNNVTHCRPGDIFVGKHLQGIGGRHDVPYLHLRMGDTTLNSDSDRLFAKHVVCRNDTMHPAILINHQQ